MSEDDAIKLLGELDSDNRRNSHSRADAVLVVFLTSHGYQRLSIAYESARQRIGFEYGNGGAL